MKHVVAIIVILASTALCVVITGVCLPRDHVAAMSARIAAPPETVWATLTDPTHYAKWRRNVERVEMLPPGPSATAWDQVPGRGQMTLVMATSDPQHRVETRVSDANIPHDNSWQCTIEPDGNAMSRVTITEHASIANPVFRFVSRFVMGYNAPIDNYLRTLGDHFGAEPIPVVVPAGGTSHGL